MASEQDHYTVLQVHPDAEPEVITAAYRSLAQLYHPDRNRSPEATRRMVQINVAYEVLSDPTRRAAYDQSRRASRPQQPRRTERRTGYRRSPDSEAYDDENDWGSIPGTTVVTVNSRGSGWSTCCGCIVLIAIIVIAVSMCGAAVGLM